ncbi:MAG: hypothetical protein IH612_16195 [Desulfofustis sp.]|nr:hypothetical protein [Desulfofustis sp.]
MMTFVRRRVLLIVLVVLAGIMAVSVPAPSGREAVGNDGMSTDTALYVRGLISFVSVPEMRIGVRPVKGERVDVSIGPDTKLEGFGALDELARRQQVEVWYIVDGDEKRAVRIVQMMELGC